MTNEKKGEVFTFKNAAEMAEFQRNHPNMKLKQLRLLPLPACPKCYGTGHTPGALGLPPGAYKVCGCVKLRPLKFAR